jgi:hypothetical protein
MISGLIVSIAISVIIMLKSYPEQNLLLVDCSNLEEDWVKCDFKDFMPSTLDVTNCVVEFLVTLYVFVEFLYAIALIAPTSLFKVFQLLSKCTIICRLNALEL